MALSSRAAQKVEAKYGVTADFLDLQLHSAAANGNVGLVKYALMNGQPVNSVLNGVLPIHVAASSGNEMIVRMLLEAGADVNAGRLPRKYNQDRSKSNSIGAAGSTPLHFAAANGHVNVVSLLLSHGANIDLADKHGMTSEDLARDHQHLNVVSVLQLWQKNRAANHPDNSDAASIRTTHESPTRKLLHSATSGSFRDLKSTLTASHANNSSLSLASLAGSNSDRKGKKLLTKPSIESMTNKGKKLAKAASNPNLAGLLTGNHAAHAGSHGAQSSQNPYYIPLNQPGPTLRQNPYIPNSSQPSSVMARQATLPAFGPAHLHHIVNVDKARRPSLPSVFEKAAHPSQSIRQALGMTPSHSSRSNGAPSIRRDSDSKDNDPYHIGRPKRSSSKTSLSSVFRHGHASRDRGASEHSTSSQPLSPAASSFFTGDDALEQADRDAFLRREGAGGTSSGEETQQQHHYHQLPHRYPGAGASSPIRGISRRASAEGLHQGSIRGSGRSRAGSNSSAATAGSGSGRSFSAAVGSSHRQGASASLYNYPTTAPATQTSFFPNDPSSSALDLHSYYSSSLYPHGRPAYNSSNTSFSSSVFIPQPIPAPPTTSTQPFFTKAAISAAHNNNTTGAVTSTTRPGFYRPRKSSQLSSTASTMISPPMTDSRSMMGGSPLLYSPPDFESPAVKAPFQSANQLYDGMYDDEYISDRRGQRTSEDGLPLAGPSVIIRRPTVQDRSRGNASDQSATSPPTSSPPPTPAKSSDSYKSQLSILTDNSDGSNFTPTAGTPLGMVPIRSSSQQTQQSHQRSSSDGTASTRTSRITGPSDATSTAPPLAGSAYAAASSSRQRSQSSGVPYTVGTIITSPPYAERQVGPGAGGGDADEEARESEDTFPEVPQAVDRGFMSRSRAGSRARVDSVGSNGSTTSYGAASSGVRAATGYVSPSWQGSSSFSGPLPQQAASTQHAQTSLADTSDSDAWMSLSPRPSRSGSVGTDTRTSRSGSVGEQGNPASRLQGYDYSTSPASSSSFNYQPSNSTTATSLVSSPPGTTYTHAQAQNMVKRKEEELLQFVSPPQSQAGASGRNAQQHYQPQDAASHRQSLSQQLVDYAERLSMARQLSDAEKERKHPNQSILLTIPDEQFTEQSSSNTSGTKKYSWEVLGKDGRGEEKRTVPVPFTRGERAKGADLAASQGQYQVQPRAWTHKMVSPFEVPLNRPAGAGSAGQANLGHKHTSSSGQATIRSDGKPTGTKETHEPSNVSFASPGEPSPAGAQISSAGASGKEHVLRNKPSQLSTNTSYLAPPPGGGGSDLSISRRSPRLPSPSSGRSPRTSVEKDRTPSATYTYSIRSGSGVGTSGGHSDPATDSANSSLVSEPRSSLKSYGTNATATTSGSASTYTHSISSRHRHSRSDPHNNRKSASSSPDTSMREKDTATLAGTSFASMNMDDATPKQPQLMRLETVMAPKFHVEQKAGGIAAPSPTKNKFSTKFGKLFK